MKKLLLMFLLASGATVMANNTDPIQEKKLNQASHTAHAVKETVKISKGTPAARSEAIREDHASHIVPDNSRYGIGASIVEFINRNNVKIMRRLLID